MTANYHSLSCKLWELGSNDQRGEGTVISQLEMGGSLELVGGFSLLGWRLGAVPFFPHHHLHATPWFKAGRSRARSGHLSSPMGNVMAEPWGNARASSVLGQDQLAPRSSASTAAAKGISYY